jgi:hypothetical protein
MFLSSGSGNSGGYRRFLLKVCTYLPYLAMPSRIYTYHVTRNVIQHSFIPWYTAERTLRTASAGMRYTAPGNAKLWQVYNSGTRTFEGDGSFLTYKIFPPPSSYTFIDSVNVKNVCPKSSSISETL